MCGIAGIIYFDATRAVDRPLLERMTNVLAHRGPDGAGFYAAGNLGLGHRRLAIIDLATGDQPMLSHDRSLALVFNGEIYNYVELREELKALGHSFKTTSDTEVILSAYQQWGLDCQKKFNGMWAFALWDARENRLLLSRDRLGEKPLYFAGAAGGLFFGSEIKSILATGLQFPPALELMHVYLSFGYVPAPYSFYKGISKLMPGHCLTIQRGQVHDHTYWDLPPLTEKEMRRDAVKVYAEFKERFDDSVRIRMRSDVPYGAFLSGGLDSSSVVAAMSGQSSNPVETFTVGFTEKSYDERQLAQEVAEQFRTHHHEEVAVPETFDEALARIVAHFDEPFGDASAMPVGLVSRLARQKVTMALTGDGGDEVLSGYTSYIAERFAEKYRVVPGFLRHGCTRAVGLASSLSRGRVRYSLNRVHRSLRLCGGSFEERFIWKLSLLEPESIRRLVPSSIPQLLVQDFLSDLFARCTFQDPFYRLMYFHMKVSLPDDMLAKVDRMSMAHSLETRVPFLDHRLVELGWSVDKRVKLPGYTTKDVLRRTYGAQLPPSLLKAPKKPFSVPLREWFKQNNFSARLEELARADFGLKGREIGEIISANNTSRHDYGNFIWRLFVLKACLNRN